MTEQLTMHLKKPRKATERITRERAIDVYRMVVEGYACAAILKKFGYTTTCNMAQLFGLQYRKARTLAEQGYTAEQIVDTIPRFKVLKSGEAPLNATRALNDLQWLVIQIGKMSVEERIKVHHFMMTELFA